MPLSQWPLVIYLAPGISGFKFNAIASNLKHPARPTCGLATGDPKSQARGQIEFGPTHTGTEHRRRLPQWHRNEACGRCSHYGVLQKFVPGIPKHTGGRARTHTCRTHEYRSQWRESLATRPGSR